MFKHTLLVIKDRVEVLTIRLEDSPGGPVAMPPEVKKDEEGERKDGEGERKVGNRS